MEGLKTSIPQRLYIIRIITTLGLFFSFFLSFKLWAGEHLFPGVPAIQGVHIAYPFDLLPVILSSFFLICSLVLRRTRLFIFLSLCINLFIVLLDMNRLQPWFYIYNAILFVFLFHDGRVDNPNRFTSIFIFIQMIIASVYIYNGLNQAMNPLFVVTDFYDIILPLKKIMSERQFLFFLKAGKIVPFIPIFIGLGLLVRPVKYLAISFAVAMHLLLFILLFPSAANPNYALWFMNIVFGTALFFLFSGETRQRYFSTSVLLARPMFYIIIACFWIMPALRGKNYWPESMCFNFRSGATPSERIHVSEESYSNLPYYVRGFCSRNGSAYTLNVSGWCGHELNSDYFNHDSFAGSTFTKGMQVVTSAPPIPGRQLSAR